MATKKTQKNTRRGGKAQTSTGKVLAGIACFGLAALLLYLAVTTPEAGTAMGALKGVLQGVGGSLAVALPLIFVWIGVLLVCSGHGRRLSLWRIALDGLLIVNVFAAVELFFAGQVAASGASGYVFSYFDFIAKAYKLGRGGGALGGLIAWPLYKYVGAWGGLIVILVAAVIVLAAEGRLSRLGAWLDERSADARERREERAESRRSAAQARAAQAAFEVDELEEAFQPIGYEGAANLNSKPARRPRRAKPAAADEAPAFRSDRVETDSDRRRERRLFSEEPAEKEKKKPAKDKSSLYLEDIDPDLGPDALETQESIVPIEEAPDLAPSIVPTKSRKSAAKKEKKGKGRLPETEAFTPNESYAHHVQEADDLDDLFEPHDYEGHADPDAPEEDASFEPAALRREDLRIEPDEYEKPDDEAPFDVPEKKELPKLRRVQPEEVEEESEPYNYPPLDLLPHGDRSVAEADEEADLDKARQLEETLKSFGIATRLTGIAHGPAVTRFELKPAPGVKVSRITTLADDIALNLAATRVRIEAPIPGKPAVGVEIPNDKVETVPLRDVLESSEARRHPSRVAVALGKDNSGRYIVADIAKMPHVLIAGQTGSGKSVCINSLIISILYRATPDEVKLILIDPKVVELSVYNDIPHLIAPVVTDPKKAASALQWAVSEMEGRYKKFAERNVRNIKGYNSSLKEGEKPMPQMVIIIDELADLMMVAPGEVEDSICRLAQLARAAGMHLVIATQRPSVNVITGIIKANIPTRIAFLVASQVDSRTIIDHGGAEKLLGYGDMLFVPSGAQKSMRVQGAWVSDDEVNAVVEYIKSRHSTTYDEDMVEHINNAALSDAEREEVLDEYDPRLPEAVEIVLEAGQASISMLQRRMRVGYARAGRLIDEMALRGIVSEADGAKPREVLITREQFQQMFEEDEAEAGA